VKTMIFFFLQEQWIAYCCGNVSYSSFDFSFILCCTNGWYVWRLNGSNHGLTIFIYFTKEGQRPDNNISLEFCSSPNTFSSRSTVLSIIPLR